MRQFTMNIDDGLLRAAKAHALNTGRSVSDIVRDVLAREVGWSTGETRAPIDDTKARPLLQSYSEGRVTRRQPMNLLGIGPDRYQEFVGTTELAVFVGQTLAMVETVAGWAWCASSEGDAARVPTHKLTTS